jgi:phage major head subunit gpT-like protein
MPGQSLSASQLAGFRTRYETLFNQNFNLAKPLWDRVAMRVDSGMVAQVVHRWMQGMKMPRKFEGARKGNLIDSAGFTILNETWESTDDIPRADIERDQYGVWDPLISRRGAVCALHNDKLVFELMSDALATPASYKAYDNQNFFGTHNASGTVKRVSSAYFTNLATGALTLPNLTTAIANLRNRRDNEGNPLAGAQARPLLVVPPALSFTAAALATQSFVGGTPIGSGASSATNQNVQIENILKGTFDYIEAGCPFLKTSTEWHVIMVDPVFRPVCLQMEVDVQLMAPPTNFMKEWEDEDKFRIGTYQRKGYGLAIPELCYASTGAG